MDKAGFILIWPEFSTLTDDRFNTMLPIAESFVSPQVFLTKTDYATACMLGHMLELAKRRGATGQVTSDKTGDVAVAYAPMQTTDQLRMTTYGQEFIRVRQIMAGGSRPVPDPTKVVDAPWQRV